MTLGAGGADIAAQSVAAAAALIVETCAILAVQAARRGELEAASYLLEQALNATRVRREVTSRQVVYGASSGGTDYAACFLSAGFSAFCSS
ncbi:MAG: hypothetical protein D3M94_22245, partial [Rhodocyclales bacterium GT-UBC]